MLRLIAVFILFCSSYYSSNLYAQNNDKQILNEVIDFTKDSTKIVSKKFQNKYLINELEENKRFQNSKMISDSINIIEIVDNDTVILEKYKFLFTHTLQKLQNSNNKRIGLKTESRKNKDDKMIFLSHPIYSSDNKFALIWVQTYCGPMCGSGELFILENQNGNWRIIDRVFKTIS